MPFLHTHHPRGDYDMSTRTTVTALAGTALLALTGCGAATVSDKPAAPRTTPGTPTPATTATPSKATETASLPSMTGKGLRYAQDQAQAAGFYGLTSHDATGQNRIVFMESNWQICTQNPTPGTKLDGRPVKFNAVKFNEPC
jgi:hypothetical protein